MTGNSQKEQVVASYEDIEDFGGANGSDTIERRFVGVYTGAGGDIKVTTAKGTDVVIKGLPGGVNHAGQFKKIWATGTTATDILGLV